MTLHVIFKFLKTITPLTASVSHYAQMGKHEQAIKWLTRAVETGLPCYPSFEKDPLLDGMRGVPDFQRLIENLKKYWRSVNDRYATS